MTAIVILLFVIVVLLALIWLRIRDGMLLISKTIAFGADLNVECQSRFHNLIRGALKDNSLQVSIISELAKGAETIHHPST